MSSTLKHYGILGMKWGVRRSDTRFSGTKGTDSGSRKTIKEMSDDDLQSKVRRLNLEKQYTDLSKENKKVSGLEKTKKVLDVTSTIVNQAKSLNLKTAETSSQKLDLSKMTDKQLRDRINRTMLEKQYNDMFGRESVTVSKGQRYVSNVLNVAGTLLTVAGSSVSIALAIKELRK